MGLLLSKVWLTINTGPFQGRLHEFPDQGLFMTHGPWISPTMYVIQGGLFLALGIVLYAVCFPPSRRRMRRGFGAAGFADPDSRSRSLPR